MKLASFLTREGFRPAEDVEGRCSIADLFRPPRKRCGIYLLQFRNNEFYVGQAIDVVRRHAQHTRNHQDIITLRFRPTAATRLERIERYLIATLEQMGCKLRNIAFASIPPVEADFDLLMPKRRQDRWLNDTSYNYRGRRQSWSTAQHRRYRSQFLRLSREEFFEDVCQFLNQYCSTCVPAARSSELAFWSLSCLPKGGVYTRLSINRQEVLTVLESEGELFFLLHVAAGSLQRHLGRTLRKRPTSVGDYRVVRLSKTGPLVRVDGHRYVSGGQDQLRVVVVGLDDALRVLSIGGVIRSIREFNWRLMRKGGCSYSRYHCPQLADRVLT